jgi:hypothetical protein
MTSYNLFREEHLSGVFPALFAEGSSATLPANVPARRRFSSSRDRSVSAWASELVGRASRVFSFQLRLDQEGAGTVVRLDANVQRQLANCNQAQALAESAANSILTNAGTEITPVVSRNRGYPLAVHHYWQDASKQVSFILPASGLGCRVLLDRDATPLATSFPQAFLPGSQLPSALLPMLLL